MQCPKCPGILEQVKLGEKNNIAIDRCPMCRGLWFDKNELASVITKDILDTVEHPVELEPTIDEELLSEVDFDKIEISCPRCKGEKKMKKIPSLRNKKIIIDYCQDCEGVWLDAGEYNRISKRTLIESKLENVIDFFRLYFASLFKGGR